MDTIFTTVLQRHLRFAAGIALTPGSDLRALGLDSLQAIELLFDVEDAFEVVIPDERLTDSTFQTAGSLWAVIDELRRCAPAEGDGG